jgi:two-component system copper resistance phosphate regulon response regulator CusR
MYVLIIEDEDGVARFLQKGFEADASKVDLAKDGLTGLRKARQGTHDLIILDLMLPGRSGFEILEQLREAKISTPVIILSARGGVQDRVTGLDLGADDYLSKPFSFSELSARVRAVLRRRNNPDDPDPVLQLADLQLNQTTRHVTRAGQAIDLTPKEYGVLEYLLRSQGRVLSRVLIMEHIWGVDFDTGSNVVDVVINRLRRKIDDGFTVPLIHTVRGVGYVMREPEDASE